MLVFALLLFVDVYDTEPPPSSPHREKKHIEYVSEEAVPEHITLTYRVCDTVVTGALALEKERKTAVPKSSLIEPFHAGIYFRLRSHKTARLFIKISTRGVPESGARSNIAT